MRIGYASHQTKRSSKCGGHDLRTRKQSNYPNQRHSYTQCIRRAMTSSMEPRPWLSDGGSNTRNFAVSHDRHGHWWIRAGELEGRSGYCHASRRRWNTRVLPAFRERKMYSRHDLHYFSSCIAGRLLTLVPEDLGQVQVGSQHYYLNIRSEQQNLKVLACFN